MFRFFLIFCLILFNITVLFSKEATTSNDTLESQSKIDVLVTAPRDNIPLKESPSAVTVISGDILKNMPKTISVDEALMFTPGVRIDNQANGERVHMSIRGQGILSEHGLRGIKVLLDGIPLNDPTGFASDLYDIDWEAVSKIEVLRGPAAALYGGGATAGVLNITTKCGSEKPATGEFFSSVGSYGFWKAFGQVTGTKDNLDYRVSFSRMMGDGYRVHSSFWANNISEKLTWKPGDRISITQLMSWTDFFNANPEGLNLDQLNKDPRQPNGDATPMNEFQQTGRFTGGLVGNIGIADNQEIMFDVYLRMTNYHEPGSKYIWHDKFMTPGGSLQYNLHLGTGDIKNTVSAGIDAGWQFIDGYTMKNLGFAVEDNVLTSNESIEQNNVGLFIMDRLELFKDWSIVGNLRYDKINNSLTDLMKDSVNLSGSKNFDKVTGKLGVAYEISQNYSFYANWGQGFLPPATEELASNPVNPGGFNMSLVPSTSQSEEIGLRGSPHKSLFFDVSLFYMTTDNDFDRYRILDERPLETFYRNLGHSRRLGFETSVFYNPFSYLNLDLAYTYSNFKYTSPDSINGNWLPNSPDHQLAFGIELTPFDNFSLIINDEFQSKWYIYTNNNQIYEDGFNLVNLRLAYNFAINGVNLDAAIECKNIFDKKWVAFTEPDPDGNSYQPGPGREFFGSVKIRF